MSTYKIELVGLPNKPAGDRELAVDIDGTPTLGELTAALRRARPELEGPLIEPGEDRLAGHYTFNVNGRFHLDEYDAIVHPGDRVIIVTLAMGG
jgi:hypothetical protein